VDALDIEAQRDAEILLIAEQHIDEAYELAIHGTGALCAADALPERWPVIQIVRNDDAVAARGFHCLARYSRRRFGQHGEDASGMKPANTAGKETLPI